MTRTQHDIYGAGEDLIDCWLRAPELRLGQLIANAMYGAKLAKHPDLHALFYVSDDTLFRAIYNIVRFKSHV